MALEGQDRKERHHHPRRFLADDPKASGGKVMALPAVGNVSALNIPHSSMVFDHHEVTEVHAELLGGRGVSVEQVRYADLVSFTCLKAVALDQRDEPKDAHDLIYCIENAKRVASTQRPPAAFRAAREGKHAKTLDEALGILRKRFADDDTTQGYRKDGSVAVARFEIEGDDAASREARALRQREASDAS